MNYYRITDESKAEGIVEFLARYKFPAVLSLNSEDYLYFKSTNQIGAAQTFMLNLDYGISIQSSTEEQYNTAKQKADEMIREDLGL
jgi:hypothetical protein